MGAGLYAEKLHSKEKRRRHGSRGREGGLYSWRGRKDCHKYLLLR